MSRVARPSRACHSGHPAHRPPARLATRQSSRSTHAQHTTHTQLPDHQPSAGWFTPQPQPPDQPRQSQSTSLLQPGGLVDQLSIPGPWPRRLCHAKPHRFNPSPSPLLRDLLSRAPRSAPGLVELSAQSPTPAKTNPLPPRRLTVSQ